MADFFKHEPNELESINLDELVPNPDSLDWFQLSKALYERSRSFREAGKLLEADLLLLLAIVADFRPTYGDRLHPYKPMVLMDGRRSPVPTDLSDLELQALRVVADNLPNPMLRTRLYDVLWICQKNHRDATLAAEYYLPLANELDTEKTWPLAANTYRRALQLAYRLGRDKPLFQSGLDQLRDTIRRHGNCEGYRAQHFMAVYVDYRGNAELEIAQIAEKIATDSESQRDWHCARAYWDMACAFYRKLKDKDKVSLCTINSAWTYVKEAESYATSKEPSYMLAADDLAKGIEALLRAGVHRDETEPLKSQLTTFQARINDEMSALELKHDISPISEAMVKHVSGYDFTTTLFRFVFFTGLSKPDHVRKRVEDLVKKYPFTHLIGANMMDDAGRVIHRRKGLLNVSGEEYEEELEQEAFSHASDIDWSVRVQGLIEPARYQILQEHFPSLNQLEPIFSNNPFIPEGHEIIFAKGLHAGFHGDFITAVHLLTPQLENSIRYLMFRHGVDIQNLESDGTQPVKVLGPLLGMEEAKTVFGERLLFELRGLLLEKSGFNFRNQVAHGFVSGGGCQSIPGVMLWWLTLRLCLMPHYGTLIANDKIRNDEYSLREIPDLPEE